MREGLQKLGVTVTEDKDRLTITGLTKEKPATDEEEEEKEEATEDENGEEVQATDSAETVPLNVVIDSFGDHRIAMAFSVLGIANGGITINEAECVAKTFPNFWDELRNVGGNLETNGE